MSVIRTIDIPRVNYQEDNGTSDDPMERRLLLVLVASLSTRTLIVLAACDSY